MTTHGLGRRQALTGVAGLGLGLPVLAACGGAETAGDPASSGGSGGSGGSAAGSSGDPIASASDVPVGGGLIVEEPQVVVVQPAEGEFKAFSSICTHQGCPVSKVEGEEIQCVCHGSVFSTADGSVVNGPATAPLEEVAISVDGDEITLA
jgi:Rieske Fe-S protein